MDVKEILSAQIALQEVRYAVAWEGDPKQPIHQKMEDGYWVPWHGGLELMPAHCNKVAYHLISLDRMPGIVRLLTGESTFTASLIDIGVTCLGCG